MMTTSEQMPGIFKATHCTHYHERNTEVHDSSTYDMETERITDRDRV